MGVVRLDTRITPFDIKQYKGYIEINRALKVSNTRLPEKIKTLPTGRAAEVSP